MTRQLHRLAAGLGAAVLVGSGADAADLAGAWKSVAIPAPPELKAVALDKASTALLIVDMNANSCNAAQKPRCITSIPRIRSLLDRARGSGMMVIFTGGPATSATFTPPPEALTPRPNEPTVRAVADKFIGSDLEAMLAARGIKTIVVTGTSAEGGVLYTASGAALRNLMAIVPVDAISSADPFGEVSAAWVLKNAAAVAGRVTLTTTDLITID